MSDEFLTRGLQNDRYLKAIQLLDQFDDDLVATLRDVGLRMVDQHPDLFEIHPDGNDNVSRSSGSVLAFARTQYPMIGEAVPESIETRRLNVHLYWASPSDYDRTDVDGALRAFGYKIKNSPDGVENRIARQTRGQDWDLSVTENPFGGSMAFYRHVSSAEELERTAETLVEHFRTYGPEYVTVSQ